MPSRTTRAIPDFSHAELLAMEKEMLGLYVTGHPLDEYDDGDPAA